MKKTIITLLALAGVAAAAETFTDLSQSATNGQVTYTVPAEGSSLGTFTGSGISAAGGGSLAHSGVAITLNLTDISAYFASNSVDVSLISFNVNTHVGLNLTSTGIRGMWNDVTWNNTYNFTVAYDTLAALDTTWTGEDGDKYTTITVSLANIEGENGGLMVYSESSKLGGYNKLGSSFNKTMTSIEINTDYVVSASVNAGWSDPNTCYALGANLSAATQQVTGVIPEPTTATLSMLALAGLAARRRRK